MQPRAFAALLILAGTAGCAASERVVKTYEAADFRGGPFNRVLVVGAHEDTGIRRFFENSVAAVMNTDGTIAVTSLSVMESEAPIERDPVITAVRQTGADAVLITRLIDEQSRNIVSGGTAVDEAQRRRDLGLAGFFRNDYAEYEDPLTITTISTVVLSTDLYNVADESRIWSVESISFDKGSVYGVVDSASRGITDQLRRDRLIP